MVLNTLKLVNDVVGATRKKGVAIIKPGKDERAEQSFGGIVSKKMADRGDAADFKEAGATDIFNMLMKGQRLVESDAKIVNSGGENDRRAVQIDRRRKRGVIETLFRSNQNYFRFILVKLQLANVHPRLEVRDAGLSGGNQAG